MADDKVLEKLTKKVDGVADDVRTLTYRVDKLEATTNERFDRVDERFEQIDERFDRVDKGLQAISHQLNTMSNQFTAVTRKVMDHDDLLNSHEERIAILESEAH
jgi:uncharacterized protein YoxC